MRHKESPKESQREDVFACPSCPQEKRIVKMSFIDLQEHIADVHLEHFHAYVCPTCKKKFATDLVAHRHIRNGCKVEGFIQMSNYTVSMLSTDVNVLQKKHFLETQAIFKYVHACLNREGRSTSVAGTSTEDLFPSATREIQTDSTQLERKNISISTDSTEKLSMEIQTIEAKLRTRKKNTSVVTKEDNETQAIVQTTSVDCQTITNINSPLDPSCSTDPRQTNAPKPVDVEKKPMDDSGVDSGSNGRTDESSIASSDILERDLSDLDEEKPGIPTNEERRINDDNGSVSTDSTQMSDSLEDDMMENEAKPMASQTQTEECSSTMGEVGETLIMDEWDEHPTSNQDGQNEDSRPTDKDTRVKQEPPDVENPTSAEGNSQETPKFAVIYVKEEPDLREPPASPDPEESQNYGDQNQEEEEADEQEEEEEEDGEIEDGCSVNVEFSDEERSYRNEIRESDNQEEENEPNHTENHVEEERTSHRKRISRDEENRKDSVENGERSPRRTKRQRITYEDPPGPSQQSAARSAIPSLMDDIPLRTFTKFPRKSIFDEMKEKGIRMTSPIPHSSAMDIQRNHLSDEDILNLRKTVIEKSPYKRVIRNNHACEYEGCCSANNEEKCVFCKGSHPSEDCSSFASRVSRKHFLRESSICFRCGTARDPQNHECIDVICCFCEKPGHFGAICFCEDSKMHMRNLAKKNFRRWLPEIKEIERLKEDKRTQERTRNEPKESPRKRHHPSQESRRSDSHDRHSSKRIR